MKKIGIITLTDNSNFGNKLQNYSLQKVLKKHKCNPYTINVISFQENEQNIIKLLRYIKFKIFWEPKNKLSKRYFCFKKFNNFINYYNQEIKFYSDFKKINNSFEFFITGSDQVWNYDFARPLDIYFLNWADYNKRVSYAASFGISKIPDNYKEKYIKLINGMKYISVREEKGKEIIEELMDRKDVEVLVDPTMLLTAEEWDNVSKKPKQLKTDKYILNYFLGDLSEERKKEIERVAKENNCEIINIMDKNDPLYVSGPSEFLWLEKHAFLICTDSFHSSVFALLYNRPFIVFDREQEGIENMNSRIDTLINKFNLKNRRYTGKITEENLKHDYSEAYEILEQEREKSRKFLEKALDI